MKKTRRENVPIKMRHLRSGSLTGRKNSQHLVLTGGPALFNILCVSCSILPVTSDLNSLAIPILHMRLLLKVTQQGGVLSLKPRSTGLTPYLNHSLKVAK